MKTLWDIIQTITFVIVAGAIVVAIPIFGLILGIASAIVVVYAVIREENKHPRK